MVYETGYEYYTENVIHSFMGNLKVEGYFVPESEETYHGWIRVLGKKRPLYDCRIVDGNYNYSLDAIGLRINIDALVGDDYSINGYANAKGHAPMKCDGGTAYRVSLSDGHREELTFWK